LQLKINFFPFLTTYDEIVMPQQKSSRRTAQAWKGTGETPPCHVHGSRESLWREYNGGPWKQGFPGNWPVDALKMLFAEREELGVHRGHFSSRGGRSSPWCHSSPRGRRNRETNFFASSLCPDDAWGSSSLPPPSHPHPRSATFPDKGSKAYFSDGTLTHEGAYHAMAEAARHLQFVLRPSPRGRGGPFRLSPG